MVNMQINVTTDYAIRIILYLAIQNKVTISKDIAMAMGPTRYVFKITNKLLPAGIIQRILGAKGCFILGKRIKEIYMYEIFKVIEATVKINRYLKGDNYCKCFEIKNCSLRKFYCRLQSSLERC
ncbi:RrF2 family transcriptional regulator [Phascolarctobacterium faecium]|uniref:RrF2 family transcriptional regulator n=2 Tax=Phascolarctobacterium faecium TaxID=33025 RepID=UPI003AB717F0